MMMKEAIPIIERKAVIAGMHAIDRHEEVNSQILLSSSRDLREAASFLLLKKLRRADLGSTEQASRWREDAAMFIRTRLARCESLEASDDDAAWPEWLFVWLKIKEITHALEHWWDADSPASSIERDYHQHLLKAERIIWSESMYHAAACLIEEMNEQYALDLWLGTIQAAKLKPDDYPALPVKPALLTVSRFASLLVGVREPFATKKKLKQALAYPAEMFRRRCARARNETNNQRDLALSKRLYFKVTSSILYRSHQLTKKFNRLAEQDGEGARKLASQEWEKNPLSAFFFALRLVALLGPRLCRIKGNPQRHIWPVRRVRLVQDLDGPMLLWQVGATRASTLAEKPPLSVRGSTFLRVVLAKLQLTAVEECPPLWESETGQGEDTPSQPHFLAGYSRTLSWLRELIQQLKHFRSISEREAAVFSLHLDDPGDIGTTDTEARVAQYEKQIDCTKSLLAKAKDLVNDRNTFPYSGAVGLRTDLEKLLLSIDGEDPNRKPIERLLEECPS